MKVRDIMNRAPAVVRPDVRVQRVLETMVRQGVTAVTVVDDGGRLVGYIPQRSLVMRELLSSGRLHQPPAASLDFRQFVEEQRQLYGRTAADIMTRDVVTVNEFDDVMEALTRMVSSNVSRLPVVAAGRVVGDVSHADILALLLDLEYERQGFTEREETDDELARRVRDAIHHQLTVSPVRLDVRAYGGVVHLQGIVPEAGDAATLEEIARMVPGVHDVVNSLLVEQLTR